MDCPSERGRNYTPPKGGALRPAGGVSVAALVGAEQMIPRSILAAVNHHRGRYTSPALATASYPFVDLSGYFTSQIWASIV